MLPAPGFARLFSAFSSFSLRSFFRLSRASWCCLVFRVSRVLLSRAEPRSFVFFLPPFPACLVFALVVLPGFARLFSAFSSFSLRSFFRLSRASWCCLVFRVSRVLLSRAEPRSFVFFLPPFPACLVFALVVLPGFPRLFSAFSCCLGFRF